MKRGKGNAYQTLCHGCRWDNDRWQNLYRVRRRAGKGVPCQRRAGNRFAAAAGAGPARAWQGVSDKEEVLRLLCEKYELEADRTAYIGDDIGDLPALNFAGISFCPADAVPEVRRAAQVVLPSRGGGGAVRDAAEWILANAANVSGESCNEA